MQLYGRDFHDKESNNKWDESRKKTLVVRGQDHRYRFLLINDNT